MVSDTQFGKASLIHMNNKLIENFNSQTASLIGNLNLQVAQLMTQNQQLQSQVQELQTKLNMATKNEENKQNKSSK